MRTPLSDAERERLIEAMLPDVAFDGWSRTALRAGARRLGMANEEAVAFFPGGAADMVAAFSRWADRRMSERLEVELGASSAAEAADRIRVSDRIGIAIRLRLEAVGPWREAVRRAMTVLALPPNAPLALRLLYQTVDEMWHASGDTATDFSFYTKRASLAGIYAATVLYWLDDRSEGNVDTHAFIERRLSDLGRFMRLRHRFDAAIQGFPNPFRPLRPYR